MCSRSAPSSSGPWVRGEEDGRRSRSHAMAEKRLLILASSYFPEEPSGAARLAFDLARGFEQTGCEVWLLVQSRRGETGFCATDDGLHVLRYHLLPGHGWGAFRAGQHIRAAKDLMTTYLPAAPDVIHGHDLLPYIAALDLYEASKAMKCYTVHSPAVEELPIVWKAEGFLGWPKTLLGLPIIRRYERRALSVSDRLEAKSQYTRKLVEASYGSEIGDRLRIIPGWIEDGRFGVLTPERIRAAREKLGWPHDKPVLFALRRLESRMGIDTLLKALAILKGEGFDLFASIAGTGSLFPSLLRLRARLGLDAAVAFMGRLDESDLPLAYGSCDAGVIPTRALECFGLIALEAMAAGRPSLVTPVGALPEVVGPFEPAWVAAGNGEYEVAALLRAFLRGEMPSHRPEDISRYARSRYGFGAVFPLYRELLGI